jgi:CDP-glycerol glycerophosphotransferase (TagB/SpsB family)
MALIRGASARALLRSVLTAVAQSPRFIRGRLSRRDRNVWVFGNVHGFRDSPRYMAEHVAAQHPGISVWWIAASPESAEAARGVGLKVTLSTSAEAGRVQRRAGAAFFTHGFRDLDLPSVSGAHMTYLWHGTPLKRIGLDVSAHRRRRSLPVRLATRVVNWVHVAAYRMVRLYVAAGTIDQRRFASAFGIPQSRIRVLGSPRYDVIRGGAAFARLGGATLREQLGVRPGERVVVWLPTHRREYGDATWLPQLHPIDLDALRSDAGQWRLLVKTHPNAEWDVFRERLPNDDRVRLLDETAVDVNALLHIADALVTDYSSVAFDYSILGRPIYFFAPDVERYESQRGLYDPYAALTDGRHHLSWTSLLAALGDESEGVANARRIAEYCGNNTAPETCERVTQAVISEL